MDGVVVDGWLLSIKVVADPDENKSEKAVAIQNESMATSNVRRESRLHKKKQKNQKKTNDEVAGMALVIRYTGDAPRQGAANTKGQTTDSRAVI